MLESAGHKYSIWSNKDWEKCIWRLHQSSVSRNPEQVIGIDEAQFFGENLIEVAQTLADKGKRVIVAGLDTDYMGKPFGPIPGLMAIAEDVQKVHAICVKCGNLANHSHRLSKSHKLVLLGEKDIYEPLCRQCYNEAMAQENKESED